ncbi:MAG: HAD-IIB family hydrolase [Candidatus Velthaea sp.]|jgi:HAD superfamily hydrolase (TIGR01484 family)
MRPIAELPPAALRDLLLVCTDIDDTLTTDGRLPAEAYSALESLAGAGLAVVPITGRPAGWCDMIARFWPVAGVVGENGAFYFHYDRARRAMNRTFVRPAAQRADDNRRLDVLANEIVRRVPGCAVAADQRYRESDLAIDFAEDVPALPQPAIDEIVAIFEAAGATAKISSIHVNGWFGSYDKLSTTRLFVRDVLGHVLDDIRGRTLFVGDSPNDSPMFAYFPLACGVANVGDFAGSFFRLPAYVAHERGGRGFVRIAQAILGARSSAA